MNNPKEIHARGIDQWSYWHRLKFGLKLLIGARIHYHFCNAVQTGSLGDLEHVNSTANIVAAIGEPDQEETHKLDPYTHRATTQIKVTNVVKL